MAQISYTALKKRVLSRIWPETAGDSVQGPENLQLPLDAFMQSALTAVYQYNDCLKADNFDLFPQCATYYRCGLSVLATAPAGGILSVRTATVDKPCNSFPYRQTTPEELRSWAAGLQRRMEWSRNPDAGLGTAVHQLPLGYQYPSADTDSKFGRALTGVWALDGSRLLVAPWIQSDEVLVVQWEGIKTRWNPEDLVPDDIEDAVFYFVQMCYQRDFGCNEERRQMYQEQFDTENGDLLWLCRQKTQIRPSPEAEDVRQGEAAWEAYAAGETVAPPVEPPTGEVVVAFVSDYGAFYMHDYTPPRDVATQVKSWNPAAIVTGGDNNYPDGLSDRIDQNIGALYANFIHPYNGTQPLWPGETDATVNRFWPALGNHDWDGTVGGDPDTAGQPYFDYFDGVLPNDPKVGQPGQPRFYEVVLGPMHFFILNSGLDTANAEHEPLGITGGGLQGTWLEQRAALSTAPFKIAVIHHAPYTSSSNHAPGEPRVRWEFNRMGLDLVLSGHGHSYERFSIAENLSLGAIPYVVCGTGGAPLIPFGTAQPGSVVRVDNAFGAMRLTADCNTMTVEFVDENGTVLDSFKVVA